MYEHIKQGTVEGTGAALQINVGFKPSWVKILNIDGLASLEWVASMADASGVKVITAGTMSLITSNGITPLQTDQVGSTAGKSGFTLGADTDVNVSGETIHWIAGR